MPQRREVVLMLLRREEPAAKLALSWYAVQVESQRPILCEASPGWFLS